MWEYLIPVFVVIVTIFYFRFFFFNQIVIKEYQRGLKLTNGKVVGVLEPGLHWIYRNRTQVIMSDIREKLITLAGQEVMGSDGNSVKISLVATYKIADPVLVLTASEQYRTAVYAKLQIGLRKFVGEIPIEDILEKREEIAKSTYENSREEISALGLELISVEIKDIMFPGALKQLFAAELRARKEGLAALERARGETAALRNLANAAKMMEDNPNLMQLRLIQVLSESSDNTFVVNMASDMPSLQLPQAKKKS